MAGDRAELAEQLPQQRGQAIQALRVVAARLDAHHPAEQRRHVAHPSLQPRADPAATVARSAPSARIRPLPDRPPGGGDACLVT
jgi:hypothetical protein